jgi:hypothetical protein
MDNKEVGTLLWVTPEHQDEAIKIAVRNTLESSSIIVAQISWSPDNSTFFQNTSWYHQLAKEHGKSFMLNIDWLENNRSKTKGGGWGFENEKVKKKFKNDIIKLVKVYEPNYLTLGIEVNYYALISPEGYKSFIKTFNELKAQIKESNAVIQIGLSFQLELLYGLHKDWNQIKTLQTLDAVEKNLDYLGVSTYPDLVVSNFNESFSSMKYLDSIETTYGLPIGISETGISSKNYSKEQRIDYVTDIYQKYHNLNMKFLIWGSIIDHPRKKLWEDEIGLIESNGIPKEEFNTWKNENLKIIK